MFKFAFWTSEGCPDVKLTNRVQTMKYLLLLCLTLLMGAMATVTKPVTPDAEKVISALVSARAVVSTAFLLFFFFFRLKRLRRTLPPFVTYL